VPPQIPPSASSAMAKARHSDRTAQPSQIVLASRVSPPRPGKNRRCDWPRHGRRPASKDRR
jgi:hypothetical protein